MLYGTITEFVSRESCQSRKHMTDDGFPVHSARGDSDMNCCLEELLTYFPPVPDDVRRPAF